VCSARIVPGAVRNVLWREAARDVCSCRRYWCSSTESVRFHRLTLYKQQKNAKTFIRFLFANFSHPVVGSVFQNTGIDFIRQLQDGQCHDVYAVKRQGRTLYGFGRRRINSPLSQQLKTGRFQDHPHFHGEKNLSKRSVLCQEKQVATNSVNE